LAAASRLTAVVQALKAILAHPKKKKEMLFFKYFILWSAWCIFRLSKLREEFDMISKIVGFVVVELNFSFFWVVIQCRLV
jgi:hypothetical protein